MEYGTPAEKKELSKKSGIYAGIAILIAFGTAFLIPALRQAAGGSNSAVLGLLAAARIVAVVMWVIGCGFYAKSKGWSPWMGILGILTCIGLVALVLLPDKWAKALKQTPQPMGPSDLTNYPR